MTQFARIDRVAKATGRTYQEIQAKAIERYLDALAAGDCRGEDEEPGTFAGANAHERLRPWPAKVNRAICIQGDSRILTREFQSISSA